MVIRLNRRAVGLLTASIVVVLVFVWLVPSTVVPERIVVATYNDPFVDTLKIDRSKLNIKPIDEDVKADQLDHKSVKNSENDVHYSVVIDVGSSGSRTFIYTWKLSEIRAGELLKIDHVRDANGRPAITKIEPAIHEIARLDEGFYDTDPAQSNVNSGPPNHATGGKRLSVNSRGKKKSNQTLNSLLDIREFNVDANGISGVRTNEPGRVSTVSMLPHKLATTNAKYSNFTHVEAYLARLIDYTDAFVPRAKRAATSLFVLCTAGVRSLPAVTQTRLLNAIRSFIRRVYSDFNFQDEHVEVLTGRQEGIYAWIAANYVLGRFDAIPPNVARPQPNKPPSPTNAQPQPPTAANRTRGANESVGMPIVCHNGACRYRTLSVVDMGGSSMQLAFEVNDATSGDLEDAEISNMPAAQADSLDRWGAGPRRPQGVAARRATRAAKLPSEFAAEFDLGCSKADTRYRFTLYVATFDHFGANKANERYRQWLVAQFVRNTSFILPPKPASADRTKRGNERELANSVMPDFKAEERMTGTRSVSHLKAALSQNRSQAVGIDSSLNSTRTDLPLSEHDGLQANYPVARDQVLVKSLTDNRGLPSDPPIVHNQHTSLVTRALSEKLHERDIESAKRKLLGINLRNLEDEPMRSLQKSTSIHSPGDRSESTPQWTPTSTTQSANADGIPIMKQMSNTTVRGTLNLDTQPIEASTLSRVRLHANSSTNRTSVLYQLPLQSQHILTVYDPCSPVGYVDSLRFGESLAFEGLVELRGVGNFELCLQLLAKSNLLNVSCTKPDVHDHTADAGATDSTLERCTMNGFAQPRLNFASQEFYAFSEFFYSTYDMFGFTGRYNESRFRQASIEYCATNFTELQERLVANAYPFGTASRLRAQCFKSAWVYAVIHHGLRFPRATDRLVPTRYVHGGEVQWTLGALLFKLRFFPLRSALDEQFAAQKRVQHADARAISSFSAPRGFDVYAQFAFLLLGAFALVALLFYTRCEAARTRFSSGCSRSSKPSVGYRYGNKLHV